MSYIIPRFSVDKDIKDWVVKEAKKTGNSQSEVVRNLIRREVIKESLIKELRVNE